MSKRPSYSVVPDGTGGFLAMRLHAVATFLEEELATEFAKMKNGGDQGAYSVSGVDNEFYVLREDQIALFQSEELAKEYVTMKEYRAVPAISPQHQMTQEDINAWALAEGQRMAQGGR